MPKVMIANPLPGGMQYTSIDRAESFVRRGLACMQAGKLVFYSSTQMDRTEEMEFIANHGGVLYWNGDSKDLFAMHKPGEIRS